MIQVHYSVLEGGEVYPGGLVKEDYPTPPPKLYHELTRGQIPTFHSVFYPNGAIWDSSLNSWRKTPDAHRLSFKDDRRKPRHALVLLDFSRALDAVSAVGTFGARKYTDHGWLTVPQGQERYTSALLRHILAEGRSVLTDPESSLLHAAHAAWNALARLELQLRETERIKK